MPLVKPNEPIGMHRRAIMALVAVLGGIVLFAVGFYLIKDARLMANMVFRFPRDEMGIGQFFIGMAIIALGILLLVAGTALTIMFPLTFRKNGSGDH